MRILSAKDYAAETGYPLVTLCRLIRQGIIPHEKRGAGYLVDADTVDNIIADRMASNTKSQPVVAVNNRSRPKSTTSDYLAQLKAI
ncbi:MAG: hypothetical protein RR384_08100 [Acidaminococcaceae bacterium]